MTTSEDTAVSTLQRGYEAFAAGDIPSFLSLLTDDVRWTEPAGALYPGTYVGGQAVVEGVFARIPADFTSFAVIPERFLPSGDAVAVVARYEVTHAGTGRSATARAVHLFEFSGGKVAGFEAFLDTHVLREAAGR